MKDMEINLSITDSSGKVLKFTSFLSLRSFCIRERDFWNERKAEIKSSSNPRDIPQQFSTPSQLMQLVDWVDGAQESVAEGGDSWVQQQLQQRYSQLNRNLINDWLYSGHPYTQAFIDCFVQHGKTAAEAFLFYIHNKHTQIPGNFSFEQLKGYIAAYEFENQDSDLVKRRKGERAAIGKVRKDFVDSKDQLFGEVANLKAEYENLTEEAKQELIEELEKWNKQRSEHSEKIDTAIADSEKSLANAIDAHHLEIDALQEESRKKIKELEETYEEKLRLEPAAKYWKDSAKRLQRQGSLLGMLIMLTVIIGLLMGGHFFNLWLSHEKLPISLTSLQGVLITVTILAIYAYILRLLSRLTFSSFHLMRDAEEREQLTYLYLALSNDAKVDEKSREVVLQALFSRSETGLLINEHGPVMPGMDINQLIKGMGR
ncbi:MAG: DUF6161 domain-containing protein [Thalassolituus sp.]|uniref:DUF6161 domain-containing protein n=1 Tax=Thalassolituus sp. TaxID=2030822 RepID=UPI00398257C3